MSARKSQRHGKVLQDKGLRSPLCCLADKWQMNGLTSCFLKGTCCSTWTSNLVRGLVPGMPLEDFGKALWQAADAECS